MLVTLDSLSVGGGYAYSGAPVVDGVEYILTNLTGWEGSPAPKTARTARPGSIGSFRADAFRDERTIEVSGTASAVTRSASVATLAKRELKAICADESRLYRIDVNDDVSTLSAYVELDGEILTAPRDGFSWSFTFSVPLAASDPRLFGPWQSNTVPLPGPGVGGVVSTGSGVVSTGSGVNSGTAPSPGIVTMVNAGTASGILVVQFVGPCTNPALIDGLTGDTMVFRGSLGSGENLWINLSPQYAHEVPGMPADSYLEGRSLYGSGGYTGGGALTVTNGKFPAVPRNGTANFQIIGSAGTVHLRPAYW